MTPSPDGLARPLTGPLGPGSDDVDARALRADDDLSPMARGVTLRFFATAMVPTRG
ncbi:hypothetical protein ACQVP2_06070 [Methylobacterium aquaticum]|uniref:hypothetical protein n=1 Tax=Methylobacterium aquaticum TaxID=270351 RepID=UPI003D17417C